MAVLKGSDNPFPSVLFEEHVDPSTPPSGHWRLFVDTDNILKLIDDAGTVSAVGGSSVTRASLGLDTTDSPQFAGINVGHASDTTLGRTSAGVANIEGVDISLAGHTHAGGAGAYTFLEAHTASTSASLDFTTFISSTYDVYKVIGTDIAPATNGAALWCRVGTGGGPTYDSGANYESGSAMGGNGGAGTTIATSGGTAGVIITNISNNAGYGFGAFEWTFHNLQSTAHRKVAFGTNAMTTSAPLLQWGAAGFQWITNGTAVTAVQFLMSSGNIASGTIRIYGLAKS